MEAEDACNSEAKDARRIFLEGPAVSDDFGEAILEARRMDTYPEREAWRTFLAGNREFTDDYFEAIEAARRCF